MKVLGIDDNADINLLLGTVLTASGHEFTSATDGKEGIKLIKQNAYDVVLLDLAMPEFSGFDVLEALRKDGLIEKHKIVLLTASSITDEEINELLKTGVRSYLRKPLDIEVFVERVEQVHRGQ
ncbi:MAG: response regulator [Thaumarchaeota archaeon]|nr:MAG: response regulator [Nitrososphaerota archaeon]TLX95834.1 MAG: response regulator [Nitrososphaerota archaeon]